MEIINCPSSENVTIKFEDGYITRNTYNNFQNGLIKNPFDKTIYGVGFIGDEYNNPKSVSKNKSYNTWRDMIYRCYNDKEKAYKDVFVEESWHNYSNFKKWFDENYYELENERIHLDKDILILGNKEYNSNSCIFVPQTINQIFQKNNRKNKLLPIGVYKYGRNKFQIIIDNHINKKRYYFHPYSTPEEASRHYILEKRKYIFKVAEFYKNEIPEKLYNTLVEHSKEFIKH